MGTGLEGSFLTYDPKFEKAPRKVLIMNDLLDLRTQASRCGAGVYGAGF